MERSGLVKKEKIRSAVFGLAPLAGLVLLFGQNSLAAWMISHFFGGEIYDFSVRFTKGLPRLLGTEAYQPLFVSAVYAITVIGAVLVWSHAKSGGRK